ncbi:MAG: hypothetical protein [Circular genetic element sp.]|nr:MAG: hypothetical protein [Circular genetic element sp.]|tara:strand:- start:2166 stop:2645 length:480 start_codon:yes stop_codon:yes gene_type:complete
MPRKPTEKVIEHRITLGTYERQIFSDAVTSYNFKNVSTPIVSALSDVSFVLLIGAAIGLFLDRVLPDDWRSVTEFLIGQDLSDWLEVQNIVGAGIGGIAGLFVGNPVFGAVLGSVAVEGLEEVYSGVQTAAIDNPQVTSVFTAFMLRTYWAIEKIRGNQ